MLAVEPHHWEVRWTPHEANVALVIVTTCEGGQRFSAVNHFDIEPTDRQATVYRVEIPEGSASCWAVAQIMRNDDTTQDRPYVAEWGISKMDSK